MENLAYISEQTSFESDYRTKPIYEEHKVDGRLYLIFDAILQSCEVLNRNGRIYRLANLKERIENDEQIQSYLRLNSWMGENDHPMAEKEGEQLTIQRLTTPSMDRTSHFIRRPRFENNLVEAKIQTDSSNKHGINMAIKIVDGKIVPCFSLRSLGSMSYENNRPYVIVKKLLTYDWVAFPSHKEAMAKFTQVIQESVDYMSNVLGGKIIPIKELALMAGENDKEVNMLCEAFDLDIDNFYGLTSTGNSVVLTEGKNVYVQKIKYSDRPAMVRKTIDDFLNS